MNTILFEPGEEDLCLKPEDPRNQHIIKILRLKEGDSFRSGLIGGFSGEAIITRIENGCIHFRKDWTILSTAPYPLTMVIGLVRPPTAQRLLKDLTALGIESIHFILTRLTEKSYGSSHLWTKGEYRYWLKEGAQQSNTTILPYVTWGKSIREILRILPQEHNRLLLDPEGNNSFHNNNILENKPAILAVGPERGFLKEEISLFTENGFTSYPLFNRILRTETACISGASLLLSAMKVN